MYSASKMWRTSMHMAIAGLLLSMVEVPIAVAQDSVFSRCQGLVFSTEEDFLGRGPTPPDGNPLISDGDIIAYDATTGNSIVCARNSSLVSRFDVREDLGLDAVDVIDAKKGVIAFSTELDSPHGNFGQGDLLTTTGAVIPNAVFAAAFKLRDTVGLDGVHFIGDAGNIMKVIDRARELGRDALKEDPYAFIGFIKELKVDIWFSIEGTGPTPSSPGILDGDVLSLATSSKVVAQDALLDPPVPAGLPNRGVDFGADALTADRRGNRKEILFSTEILYRDEVPFNDGDILRIGGATAIVHETIIKALEPAANFIGLDALSFARESFAQVPRLDNLCGNHFVPRNPRDFNAAGLWREDFGTTPPGKDPRRPCGRSVPIDGELTADMDVKRFRIAFRKVTDPAPAVGTAPGIRTEWKIKTRDPVTLLCSAAPANVATLVNDGSTQQWMDAKDYLDARNGVLTGISEGCPNSGLQLAVWNTLGLSAADRNDHFIVWLEWETNGGAMLRDPFDYHVQLDNELPTGTPGLSDPIQLEVRLAGGAGVPVPACGKAPSGQSDFEIWAQFDDPHYWYYTLIVEGGLPPASYAFKSASGDNRHEYTEVHDGTLGIKNTNDTGTTPDSVLVHLRNIDMTEHPTFKRCCYLLELWVHDAAIRHSFNGFAAHLLGHQHNRRRVFQTFEAG